MRIKKLLVSFRTILKRIDPANKESLLKGISGGIRYFNFGSDETYKPVLDRDADENDRLIKEAFEIAGLTEYYSTDRIPFSQV